MEEGGGRTADRPSGSRMISLDGLPCICTGAQSSCGVPARPGRRHRHRQCGSRRGCSRCRSRRQHRAGGRHCRLRACRSRDGGAGPGGGPGEPQPRPQLRHPAHTRPLQVRPACGRCCKVLGERRVQKQTDMRMGTAAAVWPVGDANLRWLRCVVTIVTVCATGLCCCRAGRWPLASR